MVRRHEHHTRVVGAFVRIPKPLEDGKVRCNGCSSVVSLTKNGKIRKHKSPAGEDCAYVAFYAPRPSLDEVPEVVLPQTRPARSAPRDRSHPSRLDVGSECIDCGKWLPGERSVCGACSLVRSKNRGLGPGS